MANIDKVNLQLLDLKPKHDLEIKPLKVRWLILVIFIIYASVNGYQWLEYSSITGIVAKYYNVTSVDVDWTSNIYLGLYPVFVVPASYLIDSQGLRVAGLIGCLGTTLGTTLKIFSIASDRYYIVMIAQGILSISASIIISLPPKIAAVWFKASEVSSTCALGVFGTQLGYALAFIVTPAVVKDSTNVDEIGSDLRIMSWILTIAIVPAVLGILIYFPKKPAFPPSVSQAEERNDGNGFSLKIFFKNMKKLFLNRTFDFHSMAYGLNVGVFCAISTFLSQFIVHYFPDAQEEAGRMGFIMTVLGMIGSVVFGVILDKFHKYKETTLGVYITTLLSILALLFSLKYKIKWIVYIACSTFGMVANAYMLVGLEFAIELTFPSEESTTAGILFAIAQVIGCLLIIVLGYINIAVGPFWSLVSQAALLVVGTILTAFTPNRLRRQAALNEKPQGKKLIQFSAIPQKE